MRLIYLSPVPWSSFSQRPHELVRYFHLRTGEKVLWVDPYPTRFPILSDLKKLKRSSDLGCPPPAWMTVVRPKALPIEPLPGSEFINRLLWRDIHSQIARFSDEKTVLGVGKPSVLATWLLRKRRFAFTFYDAMDDFPAFYGGWSRLAMAKRERGIANAVSTVLTSSSSLRKRLSSLSTDVRLVLNACASDRLPPAQHSRKANDRIVAGYVGTIAQWFDWDLLLSLATANPQVQFRLIGPVHGSVHQLPANVSLEPPVTHEQALSAMTGFDLGLIPFKKTVLTSSVDPIKYYEYRALGLPVLSSSFGEMATRGEPDGVCLVERDSDMVAAISRTLGMQPTPDIVQRFRTDNTWERRFDDVNLFKGRESM